MSALSEINVKEARDHFGSLLDRVEQGEEIIIIRRGKKVAHLIPPVKTEQFLPSLKEFRKSIRIKGKPLSEVVIDLRNEERY